MKACTIGCVCDLPAKALVMNFVQFNGYYGCNYCEQPGIVIDSEKGGHIHTFPYQQNNPKGPARKDYIQQAALAVQKHNTVIEFLHLHKYHNYEYNMHFSMKLYTIIR